MKDKSKWDLYGIREAELSATMSKDPSTKVGACILGPDGFVVAKGWNGFPRGCDDSKDIYGDKNRKLRRIVHAEANALISARTSLAGCTLFVAPLHPCASCAGLIIQSGISRVVTNHMKNSPRWREEFEEAALMFSEAGVVIDVLSIESGLSIR